MATLSIRVQPRAKKSELAGERAGRLLVRVAAPPTDGRANAELCRVLAVAAGVAPSRVEVVRGHTARDKLVRVDGMDEATLRTTLGMTPPERR